MKSEEYKPDTSEELRLLYSALLNDIQFYKSQQWSVTNYTVLIYASLIGISQILEPYHIYFLNILLVLVGFMVMAIGLYLINQFEKDCDVSKGVKVDIIKKFSSEFKTYMRMIDKNWDIMAAKKRSTEYISLLLKGVIIFGAFMLFMILSFISTPNHMYFRLFHH